MGSRPPPLPPGYQICRCSSPLQLALCIVRSHILQRRGLTTCIEKYPRVSGPVQFKLVLFKGQLYMNPMHEWKAKYIHSIHSLQPFLFQVCSAPYHQQRAQDLRENGGEILDQKPTSTLCLLLSLSSSLLFNRPSYSDSSPPLPLPTATLS